MRLPALLLPALCLTLTAAAPSITYRGFNPSHMDRQTTPEKDFWQFANGGWANRTTMPAEYDRYGVDQEIDQRSSELIKAILEEAAAKSATATKGSDLQKVGDLFASGMDQAAIDAAGLKPLLPHLKGIEAVSTRRDIAIQLARLQSFGLDAGMGFGVGQDDKDSTRYTVMCGQGGIGLPDRDFYLGKDPKFASARTAYQQTIVRILTLAGEPAAKAKADAKAIFALELRLAKASMTGVERRDPQATYHKVTLQELKTLAPGLDWDTFFGTLGLKVQDLVVRQPKFMKELARCVQEVPVATWKAYLRWNLLASSSPFLSQPFEQAHFDFAMKSLRGVEKPHPRWKRVSEVVDGGIGEALGRLYVERAFPADSKAKVAEMVENLRKALGARIQSLPWMSPVTKTKAMEKLASMRVKIGYPDVWRDYSKLDIQRQPYILNVLAARSFEVQRQFAKLGRPVDRNEWGMTPQTNNAYYDPSLNEICFPAGILQPPYFDAKADDAVNYGNIGATIGHEMTHGFDDQGRQFDAKGNLKDWWTPEDVKAYNERAALLVKQFNEFEALPGKHINGELTLGENIADLGGLLIAWDAWKLSQEGKPVAAPIEGFTPEQRFFLGYAETWRTIIRPDALAVRLVTDVHSPAKWRVNAPLANLPEFWRAFGIPEGSPMRRPEALRPTIW